MFCGGGKGCDGESKKKIRLEKKVVRLISNVRRVTSWQRPVKILKHILSAMHG